MSGPRRLTTPLNNIPCQFQTFNTEDASGNSSYTVTKTMVERKAPLNKGSDQEHTNRAAMMLYITSTESLKLAGDKKRNLEGAVKYDGDKMASKVYITNNLDVEVDGVVLAHGSQLPAANAGTSDSAKVELHPFDFCIRYPLGKEPGGEVHDIHFGHAIIPETIKMT